MSSNIRQYISNFVQSQLTHSDALILESSLASESYLGLPNVHMTEWSLSALESVSQFEEPKYLFAQFQLERQLDPTGILEYVNRHFQAGFIQYSSPLLELMSSGSARGVPAHLHVLWVSDGVLHIIPKYFHASLIVEPEFEKQTKEILEEHEHYRSGYYYWNNTRPLSYKLYTYDELTDNKYSEILMKGIQEYLQSVNQFLLEN